MFYQVVTKCILIVKDVVFQCEEYVGIKIRWRIAVKEIVKRSNICFSSDYCCRIVVKMHCRNVFKAIELKYLLEITLLQQRIFRAVKDAVWQKTV